jgi:hypothetical protein
MKQTWSDGKKWKGFHFSEYSLDSKALALPLQEKRPTAGQTTVGDVYERLADRHIEMEGGGVLETKITTDTEQLVFEGPQFNREILYHLLSLRSEGTNPFSAGWFWYDKDSDMSNPQDLYSFFVVDAKRDKIIRESVTFRDFHSSGFDPSLFCAEDDYPGDRKQRTFTEACSRFWYRRFYTETRMGQLMVFCEPGLSRRWGLDKTARLLRKIYLLLWVLIALVGLVLIRLLK